MNLTNKVLLIIGTVLFLGFTGIGLVSVYTQYHSILKLQRDNTQALVSTIVHTIISDMIHVDLNTYDNFAAALKKNGTVVSITMHRPDGKTRGSNIIEPLALRAATEGRQVDQRADIAGEPVFMIAIPLVNEQRCHGCHVSSEKYLGSVVLAMSTRNGQELALYQAITTLVVGAGLFSLTLIVLFYFIRRRVVNPIILLSENAKIFAEGNLTVDININSNDEIGDLAHSFRNMAEKLTPTLCNVQSAGIQVEQSSLQIAQISDEIAKSSLAEAQKTSEVTAATDELNRISVSVGNLAESVFRKTGEAEEEAKRGMHSINASIDQMQHTIREVTAAAQETSELQEAGDKIHQIIDSITEIADQTNLLALNAAIEAARAGEQGRGFAVVADEVRNLASRTAIEADQITKIILEFTRKVAKTKQTMSYVVDRVHDGEVMSKETEQVIARMVNSVQESAALNLRITEESQSQLVYLKQLQQRLDSFFMTLKESSSKVAVTATISADLKASAKEINELMGKFVFNEAYKANRADHEKRRTPRATNGLLTTLLCENPAMEVLGVTSDFSLVGMKLRVPTALDLKPKTPVSITIKTPEKTDIAFKAQVPLTLQGLIVWTRQEGLATIYGVEFKNIDHVQKQRITACFEYFKSCAEY